MKKIYREMIAPNEMENLNQPVQNQGGGGKKKKKNKQNNVDESQMLEAAKKIELKQVIEDMKSDWEKEKAALQEAIASSQNECTEVQQKLAELKKAKEAK